MHSIKKGGRENIRPGRFKIMRIFLKILFYGHLILCITLQSLTGGQLSKLRIIIWKSVSYLLED